MLDEGGGLLQYHMTNSSITRLVIDSITSYEALFNGEFEKRKAYTYLFDFVKKWNCTSIFTVENNNINNDLSAGPIDFASDSVTRLYLLFHKTERKRFLEVIKKRGSHHSNKLHKFEIGHKGIDIDLDSVETYVKIRDVGSR
jgi:circadian clock protein KaiC